MHYKDRAVAVCIKRHRERTMHLVWRGWLGVIDASRRRHGERLARAAGSIVASTTRWNCRLHTGHVFAADVPHLMMQS